MKTSMIACVLMLAGCASLHGGQSKMALATELTQAMNMQANMDAVAAQLKQDLPQRMIQSMKAKGYKSVTPEEKQMFQDTADKMLSGPEWKSFSEEVAKIYAEVFTEQELTQLVAFYRSPGGQALKSKEPEVASRVADLRKAMMAQAAARFAQDMRKTADESETAAKQ